MFHGGGGRDGAGCTAGRGEYDAEFLALKTAEAIGGHHSCGIDDVPATVLPHMTLDVGCEPTVTPFTATVVTIDGTWVRCTYWNEDMGS